MNLLDRHIFKSVLFTCAAAVGLFIFVMMLGNAVRDLLKPVLAGQIDWLLALRLILMLLPAVAPFALPMGVLTGVLLTLGRLSADSEITAMRSAGLSVLRIARPILILGVLFGAGAYYANFEAMPHARVAYETEFRAAMRANPMSFIVPNTFIRDFKGYVVYVGDRQGTVLRDLWIWKLDEQKRVTTFERSDTGRIDYDEAANTLLLTLTPAQVETRDPKNPENFSKSPSVALVGRLNFDPIPLDRFFGRDTLRIKQDWMTYPELQAERARLAALPPETDPDKAKEATRERVKLELTVHRKFNLSLAVFSFALIGVPLGIKVSRRETSANLGVAVALGIGFYLLLVMVSWLDRHPEYHPELLLWVPNLIFLALAVRLLRRVER
ncbi:MAG TPA: LptF/LptG family permease [Opitutaceae bacterium]|nr:LptF/LptG family permease [Opitutaceae bacterium]